VAFELGAEMLATQVGIKLTYVAYSDSPQMISDSIAGQIARAFDQITTATLHVALGERRAGGA
jgi:tripartite-type tricarboxylate transporter receptor subunit TctC